MPTLRSRAARGPGYVLMMYGGKTGRPVAGSTALAPSSGKFSCYSNVRSVSMP